MFIDSKVFINVKYLENKGVLGSTILNYQLAFTLHNKLVEYNRIEMNHSNIIRRIIIKYYSTERKISLIESIVYNLFPTLHNMNNVSFLKYSSDARK